MIVITKGTMQVYCVYYVSEKKRAANLLRI